MPGDWLERSLRRWKGASWWLIFGCNVQCNQINEEHKLNAKCAYVAVLGKRQVS